MERSPYLTTKDLVAGRTENNVYYEPDSVLKESIPVIYDNKTKLNAQSKRIGGTVSFEIPNADLASHCILYMRLPALAAGTRAVNTAGLSSGWGFAAIERVRYRIGGSSEYSISGKEHYMAAMLQCENQSKRNDVIVAAGDFVSNAVDAGFDAQEAAVPIILPWSVLDSYCQKKPFDTNLINQPLRITVELKTLDKFAKTAPLQTAPWTATDYDDLYCVVRQGRMQNADDSLRLMMLGQRDLMYAYPFIYHQDGNRKKFTSGATGVKVNENIDLTGFRDGALLSISFGLFREESDGSIAQPITTWGDYVSDIELVYNGVVIWKADDSSKVARLHDMFLNSTASRWLVQTEAAVGSAPSVADTKNFFHEMVLTQFAPDCAVGHAERMQGGLRVGTSTLQLRFSFTEPGSSQVYELRTLYKYSALVKVQAGAAEFVV